MTTAALIVAIILAILGIFLSPWFFIGTGLILFIIFIYLPFSRTSKRLDDEFERDRMEKRIRDLR